MANASLLKGRIMPDLSAYLNVYNTALAVIEEKGFEIQFDEKKEWWFASRNGWQLMADDPIQLLGLVAIFEFKNPSQKNEYWWKIGELELYSKYDKRFDYSETNQHCNPIIII